MSLRTSLKVPKYGMFYFGIDQSTSIVPTKNIKKVLSRDNKSKGSKVVARYEKEELEATIIGVTGIFLLGLVNCSQQMPLGDCEFVIKVNQLCLITCEEK